MFRYIQKKHTDSKIILWLSSGALLIFLMVIIGGITRLTHSGLSISNYQLIKGIIPPIGQEQWEEAFDLYKQYPEYKKLNYHFTLEDFRSIYFWEWLHRLIGRFIGVLFIVPFLYFIVKKSIQRKTIIKSIILLLLGILQGLLGWYMVKSGLVNRPDVSHYRLAMHLGVALITFCITFWAILELIVDKSLIFKTKLKVPIIILIILVFLQIIWGAFVAGLDAGFIHNHWPMMSEGMFMHHTVTQERTPVYLNFFEGKSGVQFIHRIGGIAVFIFTFLIWIISYFVNVNKIQRNTIKVLMFIVSIQSLLGIATIILSVPIWLGIMHQIGAFFLLSTLVLMWYQHK